MGRQLSRKSSGGNQQAASGSEGPARPATEEALLLPSEEYGEQACDDPRAEFLEGTSGPLASTCNLVNTLVGAGIVALPRLVATLGVAVGTAALVLVPLLSVATLAILTREGPFLRPSFLSSPQLSLVWGRASSERRQWTYPELLRKGLGPRAAATLQWCIVLNNAGLLITYLIMLGDVLVGSPPGYTGVVSNLLGRHGSPWFVTRPFVVAVAALVFLIPLASLRSLKGLVGVSALGLALAVAFGALAVVLAILAVAAGSVHSVGWWPSPELAGDTLLSQLATLIGTLPVAATAYICHYQIHPLMRDLKNFSVGRMMAVINIAMGLSSVAYLAVAIGLHLVFRGAVKSDVLLNFVPEALEPLVGAAAAAPLCYTVWLGYAANLVITYPMILWAGREMALQLLLGSGLPSGEAAVPRGQWLAFSWTTVAVTYAVAMLVPDIWPVITVTGATAGVAIGYAFPACLYATFPAAPGSRAAWGQQGAKWALLALSATVAVVATGQQVWAAVHGSGGDSQPSGAGAGNSLLPGTALLRGPLLMGDIRL